MAASGVDQAIARLEALFEDHDDGLLVAMSGGVDSCTLAMLAHRVLGDDLLAITLDAESTSRDEIQAAGAFAAAHDLPHEIVEHSELSDPAYVKNDRMRCFHCRRTMTERLIPLARERGIPTIAMGYLASDQDDHRPGLQAALDAGVWMPYLEAGIDKGMVRAIATHLDLDVAERPSNACLSSRIAYGLEVTDQRLEQVEHAEAVVKRLCDLEQVRVRHHGQVARIEVPPEQREAVLAKSAPLTEGLQALGFTYVTMDLLGYRPGSMNLALEEEPIEIREP